MSLEDHRREVDRIDREILRLLGERLQVARAIGEAKLKSGAPVYAPQREEQLLRSITEAAPAIPASGLRAVYREIISLSIGAQMAKPVAYLGPEGSFTQQAQIRAFGTSVPSLPLRAIGDVFAAVESGEASYGVVPVENSTEGVVSHSLDLLAESDLEVVAHPAGEEGTHRPINQSGDECGPLWWTAFSAHEAAWDATGGIQPLFVITHQGEEVDAVTTT